MSSAVVVKAHLLKKHYPEGSIRGELERRKYLAPQDGKVQQDERQEDLTEQIIQELLHAAGEEGKKE